MRPLLLFLSLTIPAAAQLGGPGDRHWRIRAVGTFAAMPGTCTSNRDVYVCSGSGCSPNPALYYCISGTFTLLGASATSSFSAITTGSNTAATMTVGNGATITVSGTGVNNANQINGATAPTSAGFVGTNGSGQLVAATQQHSIDFLIDGGGSAISTGDLNVFPTAAFACTINRVDVSADQSGSITVDIWKRAGAIPTSAQKISASAPATLSSAQLSQNGSLTGWTTSVSSGDVFGATVASASTVTRVLIQLRCQ